jgi:hypothetical protein
MQTILSAEPMLESLILLHFRGLPSNRAQSYSIRASS